MVPKFQCLFDSSRRRGEEVNANNEFVWNCFSVFLILRSVEIRAGMYPEVSRGLSVSVSF